MLLKTGTCFTNELEKNCQTVADCISALPLGTAAVAGVTALLGPDKQYHIIPPAVAPTPQVLSVTGNTVALSGGGGSIVIPDSDTQDLTLVGNVLSLTNGGSVTLPTSIAPAPQVLSILGQTLALSGGGGSVLLPDTDTQDLSISGSVISLTNGGSVTLPAPTLSILGSELSISGGNTIQLPVPPPIYSVQVNHANTPLAAGVAVATGSAVCPTLGHVVATYFGRIESDNLIAQDMTNILAVDGGVVAADNNGSAGLQGSSNIGYGYSSLNSSLAWSGYVLAGTVITGLGLCVQYPGVSLGGQLTVTYVGQ